MTQNYKRRFYKKLKWLTKQKTEITTRRQNNFDKY